MKSFPVPRGGPDGVLSSCFPQLYDRACCNLVYYIWGETFSLTYNKTVFAVWEEPGKRYLCSPGRGFWPNIVKTWTIWLVSFMVGGIAWGSLITVDQKRDTLFSVPRDCRNVRVSVQKRNYVFGAEAKKRCPHSHPPTQQRSQFTKLDGQEHGSTRNTHAFSSRIASSPQFRMH